MIIRRQHLPLTRCVIKGDGNNKGASLFDSSAIETFHVAFVCQDRLMCSYAEASLCSWVILSVHLLPLFLSFNHGRLLPLPLSLLLYHLLRSTLAPLWDECDDIAETDRDMHARLCTHTHTRIQAYFKAMLTDHLCVSRNYVDKHAHRYASNSFNAGLYTLHTLLLLLLDRLQSVTW